MSNRSRRLVFTWTPEPIPAPQRQEDNCRSVNDKTRADADQMFETAQKGGTFGRGIERNTTFESFFSCQVIKYGLTSPHAIFSYTSSHYFISVKPFAFLPRYLPHHVKRDPIRHRILIGRMSRLLWTECG